MLNTVKDILFGTFLAFSLNFGQSLQKQDMEIAQDISDMTSKELRLREYWGEELEAIKIFSEMYTKGDSEQFFG